MARATKPPRAGTSGRIIWVQGMLCGGVLALATPTAILLVGLLAPAALAWHLDRQPGKPVARAVAVCALAGAIGPLAILWRSGHSLTVALAMLGDPFALLPAWAAAGGGWLLADLLPLLLRFTLEITANARAARLRAESAQLQSDWGVSPPGTSG